ncbi:LOW QUALITY PROTEIN: hypothetical protein Cgig2_000469 [Carnegiea gigantea]|uniref:Protein kinase domain-containing protein n=1 Tax=Carnegiea gigantea TaxID=171969 RepID=A0A9Q1QCC9_9CARY|nr:LOW QUALITY PROTEIN: hypothetical protein Cgig2_000469 [Carnegiea gigantea]
MQHFTGKLLPNCEQKAAHPAKVNEKAAVLPRIGQKIKKYAGSSDARNLKPYTLSLMRWSAIQYAAKPSLPKLEAACHLANFSLPLSMALHGFEFGFQQFANNNDLFLLTIWYAKIPDTTVWDANEGKPVCLGLTSSNAEGNHKWNTSNELRGAGFVTYGYMNDTGNFALRSSSYSDASRRALTIPQTYCCLPRYRKQTVLSDSNFTKGRFQLRLLHDGNLVLNTRDLVTGFAYGADYVSGTNDAANSANVGFRVMYDVSGYMYILIKNGLRFDLTPPEKLKVTLNFDGVLTWYYHTRIFASNKDFDWSKIQSQPDNICMKMAMFGGDCDSGVCITAFAALIKIKGQVVIAPSYSLFDPNDIFGSCKTDFQLDACEAQGHDAVKGTSCWKKKLPLSNGRQDGGVNKTAWLREGITNNSRDPIDPTIPPPELNKKEDTVFPALFGGSLFVNFAPLSTIGLGMFIFCNKKKSSLFQEDQSTAPKASRGNKWIQGRSAFGVVYKGMIRSLVRLIGFCNEEDHRLLVYEYVSNGSVADYVFHDLGPSWMTRIQVAQGIARGLLYLHEECSTQIIHCDIKPQNIPLMTTSMLTYSQMNPAVRGTKGYLAAEWFRNKSVTAKADFWVLSLEIICCRRRACMETSKAERAILTDWAFDCYPSQRLDSLVNDDIETLNYRLYLEKYIKVSVWYIQEAPSL